jgi:5-methyltetrahydrofolate--homocysteine methyltransferase
MQRAEVAATTVASERRHLDEARRYVAAEARTAIEVAQAEARLASAEVSQVQADNAVAVARAALARAIGDPRPRRRHGHDDPAHKLGEADYRASASPPTHDLKGNNDLLVLTRPDVIASIHRRVPRRRRRHHRDQHVQRHAIAQATTAWKRTAYELNVAAARSRAPRPTSGRTPERPRFVAGSIGPMNRTLSISPDVNDPPPRNVTFDVVRRLRRAGARPARRRRRRSCSSRPSSTRSTPRPPRRRSTRSFAERAAAADHDLVTITDKSGRTLSGQTIEAFWTERPSTQAPSPSASTARSARGDAPVPRGARRSRRAHVTCYPNAGLPNAFGGTTRTPCRPAACSREFARERPGQHRRRLLRHDARSHRADRRRRRGLPPRPLPPVPSGPHAASAGLEPLGPSAPTPTS